ncbi:MAG: LiaF transmembrane domain-containing protein [Bacteroidia bacterium]
MDIQDSNKEHDELWKNWEKDHRRGKIFGGIVIVAAGVLFLAKELGVEIPTWIFSWKMGLMAIGLVIGVKHKFLNPGWLVLMLVGGAFLINDIYPDLHIRPLVWPIVVILLGLFMIFKPRRHEHRYWKKWHRHHHRHYSRYYHHRYGQNPFENYGSLGTSSEDYLDSTTIFGSVQKNIISKDFKGGEVTVVFGGAEINLSQADFNGKITLEITQVFGGTKLILPANWEIKSELITVMASIEDKRPILPNASLDPNKVVILRGNVCMGGIDIRSY